MGDVYRPTVRMDDAFQKYIDSVFHASVLDRNQIFRLMLFTAPHSTLYAGLLSDNLKQDFDAPIPSWSLSDSGLWKRQTWEGGGGVYGLGDRVGQKIHVKIGGVGFSTIGGHV